MPGDGSADLKRSLLSRPNIFYFIHRLCENARAKQQRRDTSELQSEFYGKNGLNKDDGDSRAGGCCSHVSVHATSSIVRQPSSKEVLQFSQEGSL